MHFLNSMLSSLPCPYQNFPNTTSFSGFITISNHSTHTCVLVYCVSLAVLCLVAQLCLTLCDHMDCSLSGSSAHGIFQARIPEWVAISSSMGSSWPRDWTPVSRVSWTGRQFLYHWATWEPPFSWKVLITGFFMWSCSLSVCVLTFTLATRLEASWELEIRLALFLLKFI